MKKQIKDTLIAGNIIALSVDPASLSHGEIVRPDSIPINRTLNKVLSTELDPNNICTLDEDKITDMLIKMDFGFAKPEDIAEAIAKARLVIFKEK